MAFSAVGTVALMPLLVLPAMIGVLVDQAGMTDASAGWSASLHFIGSAVAGLLVSLRIHHLSLRRVASAGLVAAVCCDLLSAATAGPGPVFLLARVATGVVLGTIYVCAVSAFARYDEYERGYGIFVTLQFIVSGIGLYIVPVFSDELGPRGLFFGFAVLESLAHLFARWLPGEAAKDAVAASTGSATASATEIRVLLSLAALAAVLGYTLFEAANNAQFTYVERFAMAQGLNEHQTGVALLVASLIGIPGASVIVALGHRLGHLPPLLSSIAIAIGGLALMIVMPGYPVYFVGCSCIGFAWAFGLSYGQSLLASLDRKGSVIAAGAACSGFGLALGPGLAASVVGEQRYVNAFLLAIALFAVASVSFVYAAWRKDEK
jgi:predicted MFS family arabinose efflux permease